MTHSVRHARRPLIQGRGVSLVEALVAMAVMAFGMLAVMGVQSTLRFNADVARQRSEATRIAEQEVERLRTFKDIETPPVADASLHWMDVAQQLNQVVVAANTNTTFTMNRRVSAPVGSPKKEISVQVAWTDRLGNAQSVTLGDTIAAAAPVLSGLVTVPAVRTAASQRSARHPTIPTRAHDMGNGESAFKPTEGGTVAWTFDNKTGVITSYCVVLASSTSGTLAPGDLALGVACTATKAQLLSGYVRFNLRGASVNLGNGTSSLKPIPDGGLAPWVISHATPWVSPFDPANDPTYTLLAIDAEFPRWASLPLDISVGVTSPNRPASPALSDLCLSNAPLTSSESRLQPVIEYFCMVLPETLPTPTYTWNGRPVIVPGHFVDDPSPAAWALGASAGAYKVCRYTLAASDVTANSDHPLDYLNVKGNLINQNFLVIDGRKNCPTDVAPNPANGDFVNTNTRPHQP